MRSMSFKERLESLWGIKKGFRYKVFLQSLTFFFMTACLVIWRPLKMSIFSKMVGAAHVPDAKIYSLFLLIPIILLYSWLVDALRRHQLIYCFNVFHGVLGVVFYLFFLHPVYGITNTTIDSSRYLGWLFYFFMESFDAFFSTTFWSFVDSINNPKDAKNYYGFFVCGSKIGGILSAGVLFLLLNRFSALSSSVVLPNALLFGSFMLFAAACSVFCLVKKVPEKKMHGYEVVYQIEKKKRKDSEGGMFHSLKNVFSGFFLILKNPYVLGVFSLVLFYEIIVVIFEYRVLLQANTLCSSVGSLTAFYAKYYLMLNLIGFFITLFGTTPLLRLFGVRFSLLVYPSIVFVFLFLMFVFPLGKYLVVILVLLRALNYALNHPTREVLYIPTTKDVKFKAKGWTDAFGTRIAKTLGSIVNKFMKGIDPAISFLLSIGIGLGLTSMWIVVVFFLGKTLQKAISNKRVIGK
jgi:ATP:ADP antiporter, AAA family